MGSALNRYRKMTYDLHAQQVIYQWQQRCQFDRSANQLLLWLCGADSRLPKNAAEVDDSRPIEVKACNRSATGWRDSYDQRVVALPGEMIFPTVAARMK
jgi:hypothetical protein